MKPRIATLDGIFVLNHDGFYEPEAEPEQKLSRPWMILIWYGGVCFHKKNKRWQASIRVAGKRTHIGTFATEEEALAAYQLAAKRLHGAFSFIERPAEPKQEALFG